MADYADPTASAPGAGPPGTWVRPITGPITSGYGPRWGRLHAGTDFGAPIGTPIYAASNGTVAAAGPASGYGRWVKLAHPWRHHHRLRARQPRVRHRRPSRPGRPAHRLQRQRRPLHRTAPALRGPPAGPARRPGRLLRRARRRPDMTRAMTSPRAMRVRSGTGKVAGAPARVAGGPARASAVDSAVPARVPTRVRPDREPMASGDDRPELAFCATSRQRLLRQLLRAEMRRRHDGEPPDNDTRRPPPPTPTATPLDRHQEPT
jgi:hypothetical protein